jgi:hypothetical protein
MKIIKMSDLWNMIKNVWNITRNVMTVLSIMVFVLIIVFFGIILTHRLSINIEQNCLATTSESIFLKLPVTFNLNNITFEGDAGATMPKDTILPVRIKMIIPLDILNIWDLKESVSISLKQKKEAVKISKFEDNAQ